MIINGERALAYIVTVDEIKPIDGYDRIELARTHGWWCVVSKDSMKVGDKAVFFEIDSLLPKTDERFAFTEKYKYKIKTQRMCKGKVLSQGLLMPASTFPELGDPEIGTDVTEKLGVRYYVEEDNKRKAKTDPNAKYKSMAARHRKVFSMRPIRWLMRREWGRKLLFLFFGRKKNQDKSFPTKFVFVHKTDEDRVENVWEVLDKSASWTQTTKIDGTSSTYILERLPKGKFEYYVCSRNVRQLKEDQDCYHETNVYWEMDKKYHIREALEDILKKHNGWDYVCLQGETAGQNLQGNPHKFPDVRFFGFNFIDAINGRWRSEDAKYLMAQYDIPWVPIIDTNYHLPETLEELKAQADGQCEAPDAQGLREGYVYRRNDDPNISFKNVSNEYLLWKKE